MVSNLDVVDTNGMYSIKLPFRPFSTGSMTFQEGILDNSKKSNLLTNYFEALRRRLDIIKPSQQQIRDFINSKPHTLSAGVK